MVEAEEVERGSGGKHVGGWERVGELICQGGEVKGRSLGEAVGEVISLCTGGTRHTNYPS